ncbi:hypothetical protein PABG_11310 [Paracoccidioides brasiliensis Pb03]|nr:hypothetical protein PABG_11310 [Paracoccidioides brasiliensis Pb03]
MSPYFPTPWAYVDAERKNPPRCLCTASMGTYMYDTVHGALDTQQTMDTGEPSARAKKCNTEELKDNLSLSNDGLTKSNTGGKYVSQLDPEM